MDIETILLTVGALVVVGGIVGFILAVALPRRRSQRLREEFGPEYERTIDRYGNREWAEADLKRRKDRVSALRLRRLTGTERDKYVTQWNRIQARFVDEPSDSIVEAQGLVSEVMRARGYPVRDFDIQASDLSVNHPALAENYRSAHAIFLRNQKGQATTEDLRQAVVYYRGVFSELLEDETIRRAA